MAGKKVVHVPFRRLESRLDSVIHENRCREYNVFISQGKHVAIMRKGTNSITVYKVVDLASISERQREKHDQFVDFLRNREVVHCHNVPIGCKKVSNKRPVQTVRSRSGRARNRAASTFRKSSAKLARKVDNAKFEVESEKEIRELNWKLKTDSEKLLSRQAIRRQTS